MLVAVSTRVETAVAHVEAPVSSTEVVSSSRLPTGARLRLYVLLGMLVGGAYAFVNVLLDRYGSGDHLPLAVRTTHVIVDRAIPVIAGALFGVALWTMRLHAVARSLEAQRASRLDERLRLVERDHAAFVVAAATLHDLKNPLHALGLLLDEVSDLSPSLERDRLIATSRSKIDTIRDRLDALRTIAASPRPTVLVFDARVVLRAVVDSVQPSLGAIALTVNASGARTVKGDAAWLRISLENVLRNATDALRTRASGRIDLRIEHRGATTCIVVSDDGPGIAESAREHIFEPLGSTKQNGLGLGLPIARALMRAMGGELRWEERPGWSTTFVLELESTAEGA
jgi:signal transduction histidine kinase